MENYFKFMKYNFKNDNNIIHLIFLNNNQILDDYCLLLKKQLQLKKSIKWDTVH